MIELTCYTKIEPATKVFFLEKYSDDLPFIFPQCALHRDHTSNTSLTGYIQRASATYLEFTCYFQRSVLAPLLDPSIMSKPRNPIFDE